jgi:hypothetical protein
LSCGALGCGTLGCGALGCSALSCGALSCTLLCCKDGLAPLLLRRGKSGSLRPLGSQPLGGGLRRLLLLLPGSSRCGCGSGSGNGLLPSLSRRSGRPSRRLLLALLLARLSLLLARLSLLHHAASGCEVSKDHLHSERNTLLAGRLNDHRAASPVTEGHPRGHRVVARRPAAVVAGAGVEDRAGSIAEGGMHGRRRSQCKSRKGAGQLGATK